MLFHICLLFLGYTSRNPNLLYCRKLQDKYNDLIKKENKKLPELKQKREIKLSPHIFRHSQASILIFMKVDPVTVSKRLGHSQVRTTSDIYSHIMKKADEGAAETLSQVLVYFLHLI